jgi:hypothetical protein
MDKLELRLFGLVPYNISPIQQGIQFGHSKDEFTLKVIKTLLGQSDSISKKDIEVYLDWLENWKTYIILNGGTTNDKILEDGKYFGTLNNHKVKLDELGVFNTTFREPDLGDQLTAVVFILDEKIFNKKKYPDFKDWLIENYSKYLKKDMKFLYSNSILEMMKNSESEKDVKVYNKWIKLIGGDRNHKIREFIKNFKLA